MDSFYTLNNDYFNEMDQGATQAAAKLNITESREINNADVNVQKGHIENAPNLGIDGITMVAATEGSEVDLLRLVNRLKIPAVNNHTKAVWNTPLESVREHHAGLHSFRSMRRMEARRRKARALWLRHSQSLASRRQRPSQAKVRSTIQRLGSATNPVA